jgi:hypothetical protein
MEPRSKARTAEVLPTENEAWGFWGTVRSNTGMDPTEAWLAASVAVMQALAVSPQAARELLDSRFGRHLADQVSSSDDVAESVGWLLTTGPWRANALQVIRAFGG